jgi:hypothetical protein
VAKLKIQLELELDELKNLWYLIQNTQWAINDPKMKKEFMGFCSSQSLNLSRLKDLNDKIEPLVEK